MTDAEADESSVPHAFPPRSSDQIRSSGGHVVFDMNDSSREDSATPTRHRVASFLDRTRLVLARFGRLTGMHFPGISYTSLQSEGDESISSRSQRPIGGGINQDGVFSNMNAKPDSHRRRTDDPNDRGDNDDLEDDTLPPTYEAAAADTAPSYWESTMFGGNPLSETEGGWTPDSPTVGESSDMIENGMIVGSIFAFVWNLFISGSFQFVGFMLTFLLHSTHAAKLGSRTGLGITLAQYAGMLLSRLAEVHSKSQHDNNPGAQHNRHRKRPPSVEEVRHARIVCYLMLFFGLFMMVHSMIKYILLYRKAAKLVAVARRNQPSVSEHEPSQRESWYPVGFFHAMAGPNPVSYMNHAVARWRDSLLADMGLIHPDAMHSAEDYVIRPGRGVEPEVLFETAGNSLAHNMTELASSNQRGRGLSTPFPDYMYPTTVEDLETEPHWH